MKAPTDKEHYMVVVEDNNNGDIDEKDTWLYLTIDGIHTYKERDVSFMVSPLSIMRGGPGISKLVFIPTGSECFDSERINIYDVDHLEYKVYGTGCGNFKVKRYNSEGLYSFPVNSWVTEFWAAVRPSEEATIVVNHCLLTCPLCNELPSDNTLKGPWELAGYAMPNSKGGMDVVPSTTCCVKYYCEDYFISIDEGNDTKDCSKGYIKAVNYLTKSNRDAVSITHDDYYRISPYEATEEGDTPCIIKWSWSDPFGEKKGGSRWIYLSYFLESGEVKTEVWKRDLDF